MGAPTGVPPHEKTHTTGQADPFLSTDVIEAIVKRLQETSGPTTLAMGAVADGTYLQRSGTSIVGASVASSTVYTENGFRLTCQASTPVPTSDQIGATTIRLSPFKSDAIWTCDAGTWTRHTSGAADVAIATLSGLVSGTNYDVFVYWTGSALALDTPLAWSSNTARATAIVQTTGGVWTKSGDASRRYVGTFRATGTGTTEDSAAKRFAWNADNPVQRVSASFDPTSSWTLSSTTFVAMNSGNAAWLREFVVGLQRDPVVVLGTIHAASGSNNPNITYGVDSTTASDAGAPVIQIQSTLASPYSFPFMKQLPIGYHYIQTISKLGGTGTATLQGTAGVDAIRMGLLVWCWT